MPAPVNPERPWPVYLQAFATIFPALVIWSFSNVFLLPKLEYIWQQTGATNSKAQFLMDGSEFMGHQMRWVMLAFCGTVVFLEVFWSSWSRYRRGVIITITVIFQTIVLLGVAGVATATLVAAPLLGKVVKERVPAANTEK